MSNNPIRLSDYVIKHGSHNQASHGRGGGSSGGGAGMSDADGIISAASLKHNSSHIRGAVSEHKKAKVSLAAGDTTGAKRYASNAAEKMRDGATSTTASYSTAVRAQLSSMATKYESAMARAIGQG